MQMIFLLKNFSWIVIAAKIGLCRTDLQKIVTGGVLAGIAFVASGILELQLAVSIFEHNLVENLNIIMLFIWGEYFN